jgi:hypothetical protein
MDRRHFLALALALGLAPASRIAAQPAARTTGYTVDIGVLYETVRLSLAGTVQERVDPGAGRYEVRAAGEGSRIANQLESTGVLRAGRWAPLTARSTVDLAGRRSEGRVDYDWDRSRIAYRYRGETFVFRRPRSADDVVPVPAGTHVDDVFSAMLNYSEGRWKPDQDGKLRTTVVRRERPDGDGEDRGGVYRAELVPFVLSVEPDPRSGRPVASFDITRFSSWGRQGQPARIVFGVDGRPASITASLILGTSLAVGIRPA